MDEPFGANDILNQQMEKFKTIEKEMKTKQYSTIALISHSRLDPKEQQRIILIGWLQGKVEDLQMQVETAEAELETLQAGTKKKGKSGDAGQARTELLELQNERRGWHITQLEIILRLVENSNLQAEDVEAVKEDVDFFVTMNNVSLISRHFLVSEPYSRKKTLSTTTVSTRTSILKIMWMRRVTTRAQWHQMLKMMVRKPS